jgi:hypothetical protein
MMEDTQATSREAGPGWEPGRPLLLALIAMVLGAGVELLFDGHPLGLNFPLWTTLALLGLLVAAYLEGVRPALPEAFLAASVLFFAVMSAVRIEPMSLALAVFFALALMALWVRVFRLGRFFDFGWLDLSLAVIAVPLISWVRSWPIWEVVWRRLAGERVSHSTSFSVVRGLLLALPVLVVFAVLLGTADLVFWDLMERALQWLDIERLMRATRRVMIVALSAYFCMGAMLLALERPGDRRLHGQERPFVKRFLGSVETMVILIGVDLLFTLFVGIQIFYLFGGEANISAAGYTYAEYARQGFGELVAVSVLSLGLILACGVVSKRESHAERKRFRAASTVLVGMVIVILASALKRLLLYEGAYGFTRLRTYTHVAILWMGCAFVLFLLALYTGNLRRFAPGSFLVACGFAASLNLLNVDAFVAQRNIRRYEESGQLDAVYLTSLSNDALPVLAGWAPGAPEDAQQEILPQLACQAALLDARAENVSWPSYHFGRARAERAIQTIRRLLNPYEVSQEGRRWIVEGPQGEQTCRVGWYAWPD